MACYNKAHVCLRVGHDWSFIRRVCDRCEMHKHDELAYGRRIAVWNAGQRQALRKRHGAMYVWHERCDIYGRIIKT